MDTTKTMISIIQWVKLEQIVFSPPFSAVSYSSCGGVFCSSVLYSLQKCILEGEKYSLEKKVKKSILFSVSNPKLVWTSYLFQICCQVTEW